MCVLYTIYMHILTLLTNKSPVTLTIKINTTKDLEQLYWFLKDNLSFRYSDLVIKDPSVRNLQSTVVQGTGLACCTDYYANMKLEV